MFADLRRSIFCRPFHGLMQHDKRGNSAVNCWAILGSSATRTLRRGLLLRVICVSAFFLCGLDARAQVGDYEGRPVSAVDVVFEGTPADPGAQNEFKALLKISAGE